jgi:hypothetical protein
VFLLWEKLRARTRGGTGVDLSLCLEEAYNTVSKDFCKTINQFGLLNNTPAEVLEHFINLQSTCLEIPSPTGLLSSFHRRKSKLREVWWLSLDQRAAN